MGKPLFIARQAAHPRGILGWIIAQVMSRETGWENREAIRHLELVKNEAVIDIGCGHGASLPLLRKAVRPGRVTGIDPSKTMVDIARGKARGDNMEVLQADVLALPIENATFDAAMSVHTIYFWDDPVAALKEMRRVMKPGGRLVLCCRTTDDPGFSDAAPTEVYHQRSPQEVEASLTEAGWQIEQRHDGECPRAKFHWFACTAP